MKLVTWDSKLIDFLANYNTVIIKNKEEFELFTKLMNKVGLDPHHLERGLELQGELLVEYHNTKGFTYWNYKETLSKAIEKSYDWFGTEPLNLEDII